MQSVPGIRGLGKGVPAWAWAMLALVLGAGLTLWVSRVQQQRAHAEHRTAFDALADDAFVSVRDSLGSCEVLLRSVQTVFLASGEVSMGEFAHLYQNLDPRGEFPSLQALAYAERRGPGWFVTTMVQPMEGNAALPGLDLSTQPSNLVAVAMSRDSDQVAMSAAFHLVQQRASSVDGITMRLPIYAGGPPPRTVAERRERMRGSIAASFEVRELIGDAIPQPTQEQLWIQVVDVTDGRANVLYGPGDPPARVHARYQRDLRFGGRTWQLRMQPRQPLGAAWPQSVLWPGLIASALLALLVWSVAGTRRRALDLGLRMSHRYRESEQRFRTLNDLLPALVLMARDEDGSILYANQAACARLGGAIEHGIRLDALFEDPALRRKLRMRDDDAPWNNVEAVLVSLAGDRFWVTTSIARVRVAGELRTLMVANDISEQRQLTELLSYQATHDTLTELYNRREFERHVQRALQAIARDAPPRALLYIDLDQFKLINDTSGHLAGDQLLSQLSLVMGEVMRAGDVLARLGGDEFGVLVHDAGEDAALALAERLRARIEGHIYVWEHRSYTISASIGVVLLDRSGMTLREALAEADTACYLAKDHGRNRIHLFSEKDDEAIRRHGEMEWANRLRWAIDEHRLLLDYQEIQPLQPGPRGEPHIELLLRLRDEDGRVVAPGTFLPAAERYGLVPQLDRWVISEAIMHFDALHASGQVPGRCSVNLSAASLEDEGLVDYIVGLVGRHGVEPRRLCFEITETEAVRNLTRAVRFIERLRTFGCCVALDDFGAGMSSFGYLKNLPVDTIKIDGSFIRDLDNDPMSRSIVDAITEIGHQRGMEVVAEWVDSERIIEVLRMLGVDYGQGHALHRPEAVLYQRRKRDP
jgi:diguanylate cyclase (GGDEF)-like protein/PAS domain S-box-containing protein